MANFSLLSCLFPLIDLGVQVIWGMIGEAKTTLGLAIRPERTMGRVENLRESLLWHIFKSASTAPVE